MKLVAIVGTNAELSYNRFLLQWMRTHFAGTADIDVLEIGQLASVETSALEFCFAAVAAGGPADGARLVIVDVPGAGRCLSCGRAVAMESLFGVCPDCGSHRLQATAGTEMRLREMEIE